MSGTSTTGRRSATRSGAKRSSAKPGQASSARGSAARGAAAAKNGAAARPSIGDILRPMAADLELVADDILGRLQHPVPRMVVYLITAGGKRLRPALTLLAGRSGDYEARRDHLIKLSSAVELTHTATLIHDDIIDRSAMRRQQPTFHSRFGTERAVLMGDYLYATAFEALAQIGDAYAMSHLASICQQMSRGEFQEVECRFKVDVTEQEYLQIVRDKTASLIASCCHLGAYLSGASKDAVDRITRFGWEYGMAFQVIDDCLDLIGEEKMVGKPLRSDLDKGSLSLPVIYLASSMGKAERRKLFAPLLNKQTDRRFLARIAKEARRSGAIDRAIASAKTFVRNAEAAITPTDGIGAAKTYHELAAYAMTRMQ